MVEGIESAPDTQAKLDIAVVSGKGMAADGVQDARQWESACRNKLEKNGLAIEAATKDATDTLRDETKNFVAILTQGHLRQKCICTLASMCLYNAEAT